MNNSNGNSDKGNMKKLAVDYVHSFFVKGVIPFEDYYDNVNAIRDIDDEDDGAIMEVRLYSYSLMMKYYYIVSNSYVSFLLLLGPKNIKF